MFALIVNKILPYYNSRAVCSYLKLYKIVLIMILIRDYAKAVLIILLLVLIKTIKKQLQTVLIVLTIHNL